MRSRSQAVDHDAAVARRLELLTSELAAVRDDSRGACRLLGAARSHADPGGARSRPRSRDLQVEPRPRATGRADARPARVAPDRGGARRLGRAGARPAAWAGGRRARSAGRGRRRGGGGAGGDLLVPGPQRRPRGGCSGRASVRRPAVGAGRRRSRGARPRRCDMAADGSRAVAVRFEGSGGRRRQGTPTGHRGAALGRPGGRRDPRGRWRASGGGPRRRSTSPRC